MSENFAKATPKLGFGLMRLPKKLLVTDIEQVKQMVDRFMEAGFTYFDTAYVYGSSEQDIRKALVERYPRDSFTLATKLNAFMMCHDEKSAKQQFYKSLERTGVRYFDYYLMHALMENNYTKYDQYHIWDFVKERKAEGLIQHFGFSFHASPELLDRLLTEHPEVDFVQLQINYADWNNPEVNSRANYEVARKHGKPIVVMEPVKTTARTAARSRSRSRTSSPPRICGLATARPRRRRRATRPSRRAIAPPTAWAASSASAPARSI